MTMRHGEHSATVDPGYAGSFPPSATAASTPLAARHHRHPLPRLFFATLSSRPSLLPTSALFVLFVFLTATRYYRNHAIFTSCSFLSLRVLLLLLSPSFYLSLSYSARLNDEQRCIYQVVRPM